MHSLLLPHESEEYDVVPSVSITTDPLLIEDLPREAQALPIIRAMQSRDFGSKEEAQNYLENLMYENAINRGAGLVRDRYEKSKLLVAEAFATSVKSKKLVKAREALSLSRDCAEAYLALAILESTVEKKIELIEKGLDAATQRLEISKFRDPDGYFWQEMLTRPYMRCRTALAQALWEAGDKSGAICHYVELLRLNPYDNQGIRFHLVNRLLETDANSPDVDVYCGRYESDQSAFIKFACALWKFVRFGDAALSRVALEDAIAANEFVPALLCGKANIPELVNTRVERGTPQEAIAYLSIGGGAWNGVSKAIDWLAEQQPQLPSSREHLSAIETATEFKRSGQWAERMPIEILRIID